MAACSLSLSTCEPRGTAWLPGELCPGSAAEGQPHLYVLCFPSADHILLKAKPFFISPSALHFLQLFLRKTFSKSYRYLLEMNSFKCTDPNKSPSFVFFYPSRMWSMTCLCRKRKLTFLLSIRCLSICLFHAFKDLYSFSSQGQGYQPELLR